MMIRNVLQVNSGAEAFVESLNAQGVDHIFLNPGIDIVPIQGAGAIANLQYGRMPVVLCAGRNPAPHRFNWLQEPFDQRKITRDYVKWDHEVQGDEDIGSVMQEAFRVASTEACGP